MQTIPEDVCLAKTTLWVAVLTEGPKDSGLQKCRRSLCMSEVSSGTMKPIQISMAMLPPTKLLVSEVLITIKIHYKDNINHNSLMEF